MPLIYSKFYSYINNLNFRNKILLTFLLTSLIPLCVLGTFSFGATRYLLLRQEKANLESTLIQTKQTLDKQFNIYSKTLRSLCFNKQLISISQTDFTSDYDKYMQLTFIDDLFVMTQNLSPGIDGITFYTDTNLGNHGKTVLSIEEAKSQAWYPSASAADTTWYASENNLFGIRPVLSTRVPNKKNNYITMQINMNVFQETLDSIEGDHISAFITDSDDQLVLSNDEMNLSKDTLKEITASDTNRVENQNYISMKTEIPNTGWNLVIYSSYHHILASTFFFSAIVLLIILFCFIMVLITGRLFSKKIVYRIDLLKENMRRVENGTLQVTVTSHSNDEIGELIRGFANMVTKINQLIEENYVVTLAQKEYELKALQAQINPHFLYNSLSLINWRALRLHATEISEMAQLLSSFYRTTLNKGNSMTTVSEEILNMKSYLKIQLIMHSNNFDVEYQLEESTFQCSMPNLMLQPLVENAIIHGLENREIHGKILVSCMKKDHHLLFTVKDNGIGIPEELLPDILESNSSGYGLKNVNQRAKLLYGQDYGLSIESVVNAGTTVKLTLPILSDNLTEEPS